MKRLVVLVGCCVALSGVAGCQTAGRAGKGVEVVIEGGGEFPEFLVGRWKDEKRGWEFVFEPDGTISSAVIGPIQIEMEPGQLTTVATITDGKGVYEPGEWIVHYSPTGRELTVKISLKNFYLELGDEVLEGDCIDVFGGPISQDGSVWPVEWTSFPHYIAHTPEYPHFELTKGLVDDDGITTLLTFEKITPE